MKPLYIFLLFGIVLNAQTPKQNFTKAEELYKAGNFAEAVTQTERVKKSLGKSNPKVEALLFLGYYNTQDYTKAKVAYETLKLMVPDNVENSDAFKIYKSTGEQLDKKLAEIQTAFEEKQNQGSKSLYSYSQYEDKNNNKERRIERKEKTLLRYNYEKGDVYNVQMSMTQKMGTTISMRMNTDMSINILDVTDDINISEKKFTKMTIDYNVMSFDSSKSDDELDEMGKVMKAQMDPFLTAIVTSKENNLGEVLEMKAEPNVPGMIDFSNQTNVVYPKEAVKVGSTWTFQQDVIAKNLNYVYTVKSILKDKVELGITGSITSSTSSGMATGDITGTMVVDRKSGITLSSLIEINLSINGQVMNTKSTITMNKI